jgi:hypothetical protein
MRSTQLVAFALTLFTTLSSAGVIRSPEAEAGLNSKPCIGGSKLGCTINGGRSTIQETEVKIKRSAAPEAEAGLNSKPCIGGSKLGCTIKGGRSAIQETEVKIKRSAAPDAEAGLN